MKILILSDTHYEQIKLDLKSYDYIIHAGDMCESKELIESLYNSYYVDGNCDFGNNKMQTFTLGCYHIFLTHGDLFGVKHSLERLIYRGMLEEANLVIYGHTHIANIYQENGITFVNPGAYMDGYYAEIIDDVLYMHNQDECYKKVVLRS